MSARKKYTIKTSCPQCGCSAVSHLSHEEMMERFGNVPNVELECGACMVKMSAQMADACPEWDQECKAKAGK
jgi:C4-type Zn-finger protein